MTRAFSLDSDGLSYFLGTTLLTEKRPAIVSPWLSDVTVRLPVNDSLETRRYLLSEIIPLLDNQPTVVINETKDHNDYILNRIRGEAEIIGVSNLHAKAIVGDRLLYAGSANITRGGFSLKRELCKIVENEYGDTSAYLREELGISRQHS